MPRPRVIRTAAALYHVTSRANNKDWFSLSMDEMWTVYEGLLRRTIDRYRIVVHAFVLMANHFHLIASTPESNLPEATRYLLTEISREVGCRTERINHIFGGRYRWSVLWDSFAVGYVYKYVLRNPVRAGVCPRVEQYEYSSFARLLKRTCGIPIVDGIDALWRAIPREPAARARWLNQPVSSEAEGLLARAVRRYEFAMPDHKAVGDLRNELLGAYGVEAVDKSEK